MSRRASTPSSPLLNCPGSTSSPVVASTCSKCATVFFVRESVQTMALHRGFPVVRLHAIVVSRWFVMPAINIHDRWRPARGRTNASTDHFHALLCPSCLLELRTSMGDACLGDLLYLFGVVLVPPDIHCTHAAPVGSDCRVLTLGSGNIAGTRVGAERRCSRIGQRR